jgi:hypothetical protein
MEKSSALKTVIFGGLLAGFLDLIGACVSNYWITPIRIFQSIASGLLGTESANGGMWAAALGVFLHFVIAFIWTMFFYLTSRKIKFLVNQAVVSGAFYGVFVYWFMQLVILPLSAFPYKKQLIPEPNSFIVGMLVHIFCVGLPIALVIWHYSKDDSFDSIK